MILLGGLTVARVRLFIISKRALCVTADFSAAPGPERKRDFWCIFLTGSFVFKYFDAKGGRLGCK